MLQSLQLLREIHRVMEVQHVPQAGAHHNHIWRLIGLSPVRQAAEVSTYSSIGSVSNMRFHISVTVCLLAWSGHDKMEVLLSPNKHLCMQISLRKVWVSTVNVEGVSLNEHC